MLYNTIFLNLGRSCIRYIIRAFEIKEIYLPFYTCPVVWQTVKSENCRVKFYHINLDFEPVIDFPDDAFILYTNYFGICAKQTEKLSMKYKNLIVDNSQAFYMRNIGIASFVSIRKFFNIDNGAVLFTKKSLNNDYQTDYSNSGQNKNTIEINNSNFGCIDFGREENIFDDKQIKLISKESKKIFDNIDFEKQRCVRLKNFKFYSENLNCENKLQIELSEQDVPMFYPYLNFNKTARVSLKKNKIHTNSFWNPMPIKYTEGLFQKYMIPLPIDNRYTENDLIRIIEVIRNKKIM